MDVFSEVLATPIANYQTTGANSGGSVNGTSRDLSATLPRSIGLLVHVARMDGATKTVDCKLQGSTDNATFVDVPGAAAVQFTAVGLQRLNANTDAFRYFRAVYNVAGTFGATEVVTLAATLIAMDAARLPVTQVA